MSIAFGGLSVIRSLDVQIVLISEVEMYEIYAMISWKGAVCPFYGDCQLPGGSITDCDRGNTHAQ